MPITISITRIGSKLHAKPGALRFPLPERKDPRDRRQDALYGCRTAADVLRILRKLAKGQYPKRKKGEPYGQVIKSLVKGEGRG